jgi:uncharacterized membrane protein YcaP (DUF421 family)
MTKEEFDLWDWQRIFIGEVPPSFIAEGILRLAAAYFLLMLSMRLLGKRMASQLSRNELAAMVSLASAVGVPILAPDRGLLPAFVIVVVVVATSRFLSHLTAKNIRIESYTQGAIDTLVKDAIINIKAMTKTRVTRERILAQLRAENVMNLGQVKRLYIEANGSFTLVKEEKPSFGLSVIPESDVEFLQEQALTEDLVCKNCGSNNKSRDLSAICSNCRRSSWTKAVKTE